MKRPDGVVVIAVYYALLALLFLVGSCAVLIGLVAVLSFSNDPTGTTVAAIAVGLSLLLCLLFFACSGLAAWGLLNLKNWARWLAIVLAVLQLWAFPIWTIIGGLIIYYLLRDDVRAAFDGRPHVEPRAQPPVAPVSERSIRQTATETPAQPTAAPIVEPTTWQTVVETPAQPIAAPIVEPTTWQTVVETPAQPTTASIVEPTTWKTVIETPAEQMAVPTEEPTTLESIVDALVEPAAPVVEPTTWENVAETLAEPSVEVLPTEAPAAPDVQPPADQA